MDSQKKLRNQRKLGIVEMLEGSNESRRKLIESLQGKRETARKGDKISSLDEGKKRIQTRNKELKAPKLILPESNPARISNFQNKRLLKAANGLKIRTQNGVEMKSSAKTQLLLSTNSLRKTVNDDVMSPNTDDVINDVKTSCENFQKERTGSKNRLRNGVKVQEPSFLMSKNKLPLSTNEVVKLLTDDVISLRVNDVTRDVKPWRKNSGMMPGAERIATTTIATTKSFLSNAVDDKQNKVARNRSYAMANGHRLLTDDVNIASKASNDVIIPKKVKQTEMTGNSRSIARDNEASQVTRRTASSAGSKGQGTKEENSKGKQRRRWSYSLRQLMKKDNEVIDSLKARLLQRRISRPEPKPVYQEIHPKNVKTLEEVEGELEKLQFNLRILRSEVANIRDGVDWILNGSVDDRDVACMNQSRGRFQTM